MSHECPVCWMACSCGGDVETHDTGDEFLESCVHCDPEFETESQENDEFFEDHPRDRDGIIR